MSLQGGLFVIFIVSEVTVEFTRMLRGHFVTLNGIGMHLIECDTGPVSYTHLTLPTKLEV